MNASRFSYNRVNQVGKIKEITLCLLFSCLLKSYHGFVNKINFASTVKISLFLIVLRNLVNPTREQKLASGRLLTNMTAYMFLPNTINEHYYSISVINFLTFTMSNSLQILISCVLPRSIRLNWSAIAMTGKLPSDYKEEASLVNNPWKWVDFVATEVEIKESHVFKGQCPCFLRLWCTSL